MPSFKPPQQFNFREPQGWPEWRSQFQRFRTANELTDKSGEVQVSSLIYSMGPEAENIFTQFGLVDADANDFQTVIGRFNAYSEPKRNVIHERAKFHKRNQKEGESVEEYIRHLYELSEHADFADSESTIRYRLVLGLLDQELSEKLQLESELTLTKAIQLARQSELVKSQIREQRGLAHSSVDAVRGRGSGHPKRQYHARSGGTCSKRGQGRGQELQSKQSTGARNSIQNCYFCASSHLRRQCPAYGKVCKACNKPNHFARFRACKKKAVSELQAEQSGEYHLFSVTNSSNEAPRRVSVKLNGTDRGTSFKIDTGADVSVMSLQTYNNMLRKPPLQKTAAVLRSPGGTLDCKGKTEVTARVKGVDYPLRIYAVSSATECLRSREAAARMRLIRRVDTVKKPEETLFSELDAKSCEMCTCENQTQRWQPTIQPVDSKKSANSSSTEGERWTPKDGRNGHHRADTRANRLVRRYCDSTKERRWGADLHWLQKAERCDQAWKICLTNSWRHPSQTEGIHHLYQVGCV